MERLARRISGRVDAILATTHLTELAERRPEQLSADKAGVALAALVKRPRLLLLYEPLAAIDKKLAAHGSSN